MRLWHALLVVAASALALTLARDPMTRVVLIVFAAGLGMAGSGLAAVLALFRTVAAIGDARGLGEHAEAIAATTVVLAVGTAFMSACLFAGFWLVTATV